MIYLVEDDDSIRDLVVYTLNTMGLPTEGFAHPHDFNEAMKKQLPSLVLLDIMLPEEDGMSILRRLRADCLTARLPVIMLTAKGTEYDRVLGLDSGADDYLPKPFGMMELVARIKALLRRSEPTHSASEEYCIGPLYVNPEKHLVRIHDQDVELSLKEYELLIRLLRAEGSVLTRDRLHNDIWGYDFDGESRTVDVHIRYLRAKLGDAGDLIQTVRGIGYKIGAID